MLQALLEKIGLATPSPFAKHVAESLEVLEVLGDGLTRRAVTFVLNGREEDVLLDLGRVDAASAIVLFDQPGSLGWGWHPTGGVRNNLQQYKKRINSAANARTRLYVLGEQADLPALVRYAKVLAAACQGANLTRIAQVPDWFLYLLIDALHNTVKNLGNKYSVDLRKHWTFDLLGALLQVDGRPTEDALLPIFDRRDLGDYHWRDLTELTRLAGLDAYLLAHPAACRALPERLSASGNQILIGGLGANPALAETFADVLVRLAVNAAKSVRAAATPHVETLPQAVKLSHLGHLLEHGSNAERAQAAELLGRSGEAAAPTLQARLAVETSKPVLQALSNALARLTSQVNAQAQQALPDIPPVSPCAEVALGEPTLELLRQNLAELLEDSKLAAEEEIRQNREQKRQWDWRQKFYKDISALGEADLHATVALLNGQPFKRKDNSAINALLLHRRRLVGSGQLNLLHTLRAMRVRQQVIHWYQLNEWLPGSARERLDLRVLEDALNRVGAHNPARETVDLAFGWNLPIEQFEPAGVWPFFAEHPEFIEEALGLRPSVNRREYGIPAGLAALASFPVLPARFIPVLLELALGGSKLHRAEAQRLLEALPDIADRAVEALGSSKQEIRTLAAEWLQRLNQPHSLPALRSALAAEKRETVRAALLTSLESLGEDISAYLTPQVLLAEAQKGLKAKPPASLAWLDLDALPACQWQDGSPVEAAILRWWVILACKLKDPAGNALLNRYLLGLNADSRMRLGRHLLSAFIAQDTRHPSLADAEEHARTQLAARMAMYQSWARHSPDYANITADQAFEQLKREQLGLYLGSAIADKGILALAWPAPGHELVSLLQAFMRDHHIRRAQIEALLSAAAISNEPPVIQLLLSVARRHRTASVQTLARELVARIAQRNGWSADELADRTIPSAGLDEHGVLNLHYGERLFSARLDASLKLELLNPEGKVVKALPEPRKSDDAALIKEAKGQFSASRKELKQVLELQTQRLYEAMCSARLWPQAEWREYLQQHPIVRHLVQRLVWLEQAADGSLRAFRPTEDGSLIDLADDELELAADSQVRLAHAALLPADAAHAWVAHFKDYKLKPLFAQMTRTLPAVDENTRQRGQEIVDRQGWMSDTFTLRGVLTKLGYQRAAAEDGGFFDHYLKNFSSLSLRVCISFSGNVLPEENVPAALKALSYERIGRHRHTSEALALKDIPPVLLAESYADYHAAADACSGFDEQWEKKTPW
ncbi:MAG: hypothetical protein GAK45_00298 [Pseudomonas citronellolis]|nr:MAG: hypothetical protein GAK45_00298 [Pseudomonas citronellolis]